MKRREGEFSEVINIRIDKTVRAGELIRKNCNENCIWCHGDLFLHQKGRAITNDSIIFCCQKIIEAAGRDAKIRIAGDGEPLLTRNELVELIKALRIVDGVQTICLTTNGVLLFDFAKLIKEAGIDSINISVNSLNWQVYKRITGKDYLSRVLEGVRLAVKEGIKIKINVVLTKYTLLEINDFIRFSQENGICVKFFELIESPASCRDLHLPISTIISLLESQSDEVLSYQYPYFGKVFKIGGAVIDLKDTVAENTCPNLKCSKRRECVEGCRRYARLGINGIMQPCGIRKDNILNLLDDRVTLDEIREALKSGGKL